MTVTWFTIEDLGALVRRHRVDDSVAKAVARITRTDLIIVDIALLPISPDAAEGFYRLVDAAYERRSLAVSSNLHPAGFDEIMPKTLATATVDRLLHHAHVVITQGDSHRLNEATTKGGVVPLNWPHSPGRKAVHLGISDVHQRGDQLSASGEIELSLDKGSGLGRARQLGTVHTCPLSPRPVVPSVTRRCGPAASSCSGGVATASESAHFCGGAQVGTPGESGRTVPTIL